MIREQGGIRFATETWRQLLLWTPNGEGPRIVAHQGRRHLGEAPRLFGDLTFVKASICLLLSFLANEILGFHFFGTSLSLSPISCPEIRNSLAF